MNTPRRPDARLLLRQHPLAIAEFVDVIWKALREPEPRTVDISMYADDGTSIDLALSTPDKYEDDQDG